MDRLPWSRFHWLVVVALGIIWILDGLEVTIVGSLSGILQQARTLGFSSANIGFTATSYLTGAVLGSLFFGYLTDRLDRKKLFNNTLVFYLSSTALTAFSWDLRSFAAFRFLTGAGIGGEYSAINSAIDELIPARVRGTADLIINGSLGGGGTRFRRVTDLPERKYISRKYWLAAGLRPRSVPWTHSPRFEAPPGEPRWLKTHGRITDPDSIVRESLFYGYLICGVLMIGAAIVELAIGVDVERKSLEDIASPLSSCPRPK